MSYDVQQLRIIVIVIVIVIIIGYKTVIASLVHCTTVYPHCYIPDFDTGIFSLIYLTY